MRTVTSLKESRVAGLDGKRIHEEMATVRIKDKLDTDVFIASW